MKALAPPVGRRSILCVGQAENQKPLQGRKTQSSLQVSRASRWSAVHPMRRSRKDQKLVQEGNPIELVGSACLPLVGPGLSKTPQKGDSDPGLIPVSVQAHPSMRKCFDPDSCVAAGAAGIRGSRHSVEN